MTDRITDEFADPTRRRGTHCATATMASSRTSDRARARERLLPRRPGRDAPRRREGGLERRHRPARGRLSAGAARPAAEHVPGFRLAARGPADAAHRHDPVGLGLLRLRPHLHVAFLRRPPLGRLRAVQLRDAGHGQALRGHPRGRLRHGGPGALRHDHRDEPLRADRLRRAAAASAARDQRRPHHRHRRAGLRRADPRGSQGRARRRHAGLCAARGRGRARGGAARPAPAGPP